MYHLRWGDDRRNYGAVSRGLRSNAHNRHAVESAESSKDEASELSHKIAEHALQHVFLGGLPGHGKKQ